MRDLELDPEPLRQFLEGLVHVIQWEAPVSRLDIIGRLIALILIAIQTISTVLE